MKISAILSGLTFGLAAQATTVSYDTGYDQAGRSLTTVACSDGQNGLITKYGWQTQGQIANFPNIGGSSTIAGYNSPQCGACYALSFQGKTIHILGIDHTDNGFNIGLKAMNRLTNGRAVQLGRINARTKRVGLRKCGIM